MPTLAAGRFASAALLGAASRVNAQDQSLTLCWAAWDRPRTVGSELAPGATIQVALPPEALLFFDDAGGRIAA